MSQPDLAAQRAAFYLSPSHLATLDPDCTLVEPAIIPDVVTTPPTPAAVHSPIRTTSKGIPWPSKRSSILSALLPGPSTTKVSDDKLPLLRQAGAAPAQSSPSTLRRRIFNPRASARAAKSSPSKAKSGKARRRGAVATPPRGTFGPTYGTVFGDAGGDHSGALFSRSMLEAGRAKTLTGAPDLNVYLDPLYGLPPAGVQREKTHERNLDGRRQVLLLTEAKMRPRRHSTVAVPYDVRQWAYRNDVDVLERQCPLFSSPPQIRDYCLAGSSTSREPSSDSLSRGWLAAIGDYLNEDTMSLQQEEEGSTPSHAYDADEDEDGSIFGYPLFALRPCDTSEMAHTSIQAVRSHIVPRDMPTLFGGYAPTSPNDLVNNEGQMVEGSPFETGQWDPDVVPADTTWATANNDCTSGSSERDRAWPMASTRTDSAEHDGSAPRSQADSEIFAYSLRRSSELSSGKSCVDTSLVGLDGEDSSGNELPGQGWEAYLSPERWESMANRLSPSSCAGLFVPSSGTGQSSKSPVPSTRTSGTQCSHLLSPPSRPGSPFPLSSSGRCMSPGGICSKSPPSSARCSFGHGPPDPTAVSPFYSHPPDPSPIQGPTRIKTPEKTVPRPVKDGGSSRAEPRARKEAASSPRLMLDRIHNNISGWRQSVRRRDSALINVTVLDQEAHGIRPQSLQRGPADPSADPADPADPADFAASPNVVRSQRLRSLWNLRRRSQVTLARVAPKATRRRRSSSPLSSPPAAPPAPAPAPALESPSSLHFVRPMASDVTMRTASPLLAVSTTSSPLSSPPSHLSSPPALERHGDFSISSTTHYHHHPLSPKSSLVGPLARWMGDRLGHKDSDVSMRTAGSSLAS
ncbi:unnamed protein product [Parajaminaea phylloscopi]